MILVTHSGHFINIEFLAIQLWTYETRYYNIAIVDADKHDTTSYSLWLIMKYSIRHYKDKGSESVVGR